MAETLFSFDRRNFGEGQAHFRGAAAQDHYRGEFWVEDFSKLDVRLAVKTVGAVSLVHQRSATPLFFRRTRRHIRADAADPCILWFVKRGTLTFSSQSGREVAGPGDFAITRSLSPFLIEFGVDGDAVHELLQVTVPPHILRPHVPHDFGTALFMPAIRPELAIAQTLFTDLFEDEDALGEASARALIDTALTLVGNAVRADPMASPPRRTIADRRLDEVLRFIEAHLADPQLSTAMAARGCGISPRYLSFLLRQRGISFSEVVWQQRLDKARTWLSSSDPREVSISEVAHGVGFKSPAHFSRMFKRVFQINPRAFRGEAGGGLRLQ